MGEEIGWGLAAAVPDSESGGGAPAGGDTEPQPKDGKFWHGGAAQTKPTRPSVSHKSGARTAPYPFLVSLNEVHVVTISTQLCLVPSRGRIALPPESCRLGAPVSVVHVV